MNQREIARQMVHCSGVLIFFIAPFLGRFFTGMSVIGLAAIASFLSWWTRSKEKFREKAPIRIKALEKAEDEFHEMLNSLEREEDLYKRPYYGAFNFFLAIGLVFLIFPLEASVPAVAILSISDAASTLVGVHIGRSGIPYNRKKTLEGSAAFFLSAFLILLFFIDPIYVMITAAVVTFVESLPVLNDNFSVPFAAALLLIAL